LVARVAVEALRDRDHRDDGSDADEDDEHGQERAQLVRAQGGDGDRHGLAEGHQAPWRSSFSTRPSRMWMVRRACSAMSRSWVTRMIVFPSWGSRSKSRMISSPVALSGLPLAPSRG